MGVCELDSFGSGLLSVAVSTENFIELSGSIQC
jgi:hypothetical protein